MAPTALKLSDVSDLLGALAWPLVALLTVLIFRRPLNDLLGRPEVEVKGPAGLSLWARQPAAAADALVQASAGKDGELSPAVAQQEVDAATEDLIGLRRNPRALWVDDRPSNNRHEVAALEALGFTVELSVSTAEALAKLTTKGPFDVIISDMGRPPDPRAGYTLLDALRQAGDTTPYVIYATSRDPEHFDEAVRHGAVGCTNQPSELIRLVRRALRQPGR
jgi:CheY-like chemotaxis protein